ncbi:flagellar hook-basal body complex protein FliE [Pseudoroseicyclus tamaricis]|uniref:Flagellar hook-basal body complex protein FliE n=1 Tax=Pseudoroseicyclus tamaricis TaxID=2705421 RepID=A0A6B2JVS9_9RHOB|nr:flagellar hook-basal body complex protein FliE [Pseudoroseicyclus tamaricis]NDU99501.1 flagellar hook-basal body complex protein FliE [Pseudoroseicyclus tamaricis]
MELAAVARQYEAARAAAEPQPGAAEGLAGTAAADFAAQLRLGEETAMGAMSGDADPHALVQALAQTELAVEAAVAVRNKVVEAYQEILRMPV